jgi:hypothetical protein
MRKAVRWSLGPSFRCKRSKSKIAGELNLMVVDQITNNKYVANLAYACENNTKLFLEEIVTLTG